MGRIWCSRSSGFSVHDRPDLVFTITRKMQIKGIDGLSIAEDNQFIAFEIVSEESRTAVDDEICLAITGVEVVERDFA
jgi:hypothetical protein